MKKSLLTLAAVALTFSLFTAAAEAKDKFSFSLGNGGVSFGNDDFNVNLGNRGFSFSNQNDGPRGFNRPSRWEGPRGFNRPSRWNEPSRPMQPRWNSFNPRTNLGPYGGYNPYRGWDEPSFGMEPSQCGNGMCQPEYYEPQGFGRSHFGLN